MEANISIGKMLKGAEALGTAFGNMNAVVRPDGTIPAGMQQMTEEAAKMMHHLGLTNEETASLAYWAKDTGQNFSDIALTTNEMFESAAGLGIETLSQKKILKDIGKLSKQQLNVYGKQTPR